VRAFEQTPGRSVYSSSVLVAADGASLSQLDIVAATRRVLGRSSPERICLLSWARVRALQDMSEREVCRNNGWSRASYQHRVNRGLRLVADALNRARTADALQVLDVSRETCSAS
jgi:hypothetical protein